MTETDKLIKEIEYEIYVLSEEIKNNKKRIKMLSQKKQMLEGYKHLERDKGFSKTKKK